VQSAHHRRAVFVSEKGYVCMFCRLKVPSAISKVSRTRTLISMTAALVMCLSLLPAPAISSPILGSLSIAGEAGVLDQAVDFFSTSAAPGFCNSPSPNHAGCFIVNSVSDPSDSTNSFFTTVGTHNNSIHDLSGPPITGPVSIPNFMVFSNGVHFDLTTIVAVNGPDCSTVDGTAPGVACVPHVVVGGVAQPSPFLITNGSAASGQAQNSVIRFDVLVEGYTGSKATGFSEYRGIFTTPQNENISQLLNDLEQNGEVVSSFSGAFAPVPASSVPEPGSMVLLSSGCFALSFLCRWLKRRGIGSSSV
jgi:hypothetical protein